LQPLRPMTGVPQFRRQEDVLARHSARVKACPEGLTDLTFVSIALCAVKVTKAGVQGVSGRTERHSRIRNQSPETKGGDLAGLLPERDPHRSKISRLNHGKSLGMSLFAIKEAVRAPTSMYCVFQRRR
jgi:hypothetical protein